jgi:hypothetical protein
MGRRVAVIGALALSGCASLWTATVPPVRRNFEPTRRERIISGAEETLRDRGFSIEIVDPVSGVIRTKPAIQPGRVPCGFVTCRYRDMFEVTVDTDATVEVHLKRELEAGAIFPAGNVVMYSPAWTEPSIWQKETLVGIDAAQVELLKEILQ